MESPPNSHQRVLKEIEVKSEEFAKLASQLSNYVLAFEEWLNRLPGKIDASYWESLDDSREGSTPGFGLYLSRDGKRWALSFAYGDMEDEETPPEWKPLVEAGVDVKMFAITMFPKLLKSISDRQESKLNQLRTIQSDFAEFAKAIGIKTEGK